MKDKMIRFLRSIHIENIDDFDMDFDMLGRNRFNPSELDMVIAKKTPWKYHLLRQFQDALQNITYQYSLRFSYIERPTCKDVSELFNDWHQTLYRLPSNVKLECEDYTIKFIYNSKDEYEKNKRIIADFMDFLNFISYDFVDTYEILPDKPKEIKISKAKMEKIVNAAEEEAKESIESETKDIEIMDSNDVKELIEEEHKEDMEIAEQRVLEQMKANKIAMDKERERARLNRRGNYVPIDLIDSIDANSGSVDFNGKVFSYEMSEFVKGKKRVTLGVCDKAMGAIYVVYYNNGILTDELCKALSEKPNVRIRGVAFIDDFSKQLTIKGHYVDLLPPDEPRPDHSEKKRVELHLHSNMSVQDGVGMMDDYCRVAKGMGHKAMAITDHGVTQGYPDAQKAAKKYGIKMLYGSELYMVEDKQKYIANPKDIPLTKAKFVVLDLETTGLSSRYNKIIEFGAVRVELGLVTSSLDILINPGCKLPQKIVDITDITDDMLKGQPSISEALPKIVDFIGDAILVTHNAQFDIGFLQEALKKEGLPILKNPVIDTLALSRYLFPEARRHNLGSLCRNMDVYYDEESAHRADYDAKVLNDVWQPMITELTKENPKLTHADLGKLDTPKVLLQHIRPMHVCVIAKDKQGLKDLYKLISMGHVEYFAGVPKVPRREIDKLREHLIIGSACFNGEVFSTARYYNETKLKEVMSWYDYIEIQPPENYSYLINMGDITDQDELIMMLKDIVKAADSINKMICATGDCHYVNPEDKIFRDVYISSKGVGGVPHPLMPYSRASGKIKHFENPDQHYRSTDEMLEAFEFLGKEKAEEIVITNTNWVADQVTEMVPLPNDHLYTPSIPNCENMLRDMCFKKAKDWYGDPLPKFIQDRLDTELNGIISNGFSVIYYIAHKIIKKSNEDGFLVGSRGSVGSSFVATMSDVTEVNPLPPHYRCPHCKHLEWTSETYPNIRSGFDLPDKVCPVCGTPMIHDGQNIPFQTFLGFHAEKTPDIDLNFPADYQSKAHDYTKVLLGENNVFRAGTIETVAEKTAFGFARGFIERSGLDPNTYPKAKIALLASGCTDIKRTTGQHPGGIVVIPDEYEVYDFTPIQYPANEVESAWRTTHFDFHSIHDTVLKLDLLGHVDPMALKMMCGLTGVAVEDIPMNDPKVLSLFSKPDALNMHRNYLAQKTGAMAIPEFGTNFVRGILEDTKPTTFSDLVIISGLSHGTNVWNGNAEKLINEGTATLQEVIGCRDDIMTYLISMGLPSSVSFQIMEDVRKGRKLKPEYEEIMKAHKVPQYYIDSCNLIQYLFPKGHATAYVMMAIRVGYFKVYYPLAFYATFFTVRSKQYDIATMIKGEQAIIERYDELKVRSRTKGESLSPKEEEIFKTLSIAIEMVQRGYKFSNIDLYRSDATKFVVDEKNNALIPPFITVDGLGEAAALSVVEARKDGEFFSKEDLTRRTKLNGTNVKDLADLGVLDGLPDSDQLSLFDF